MEKSDIEGEGVAEGEPFLPIYMQKHIKPNNTFSKANIGFYIIVYLTLAYNAKPIWYLYVCVCGFFLVCSVEEQREGIEIDGKEISKRHNIERAKKTNRDCGGYNLSITL